MKRLEQGGGGVDNTGIIRRPAVPVSTKHSACAPSMMTGSHVRLYFRPRDGGERRSTSGADSVRPSHVTKDEMTSLNRGT